MRYDWKKMKEAADAYDVAVALGYRDGIDMRRTGNRITIKCPAHERVLGKQDRHLGSCYLTKDGCKCYSCGAFDNVYKMVMDVNNCSFGEAVDFVADTIPDADVYVIEDDEDFSYEERLLRQQKAQEREFEKALGFDDKDQVKILVTVTSDEDTVSSYESLGLFAERASRFFNTTPIEVEEPHDEEDDDYEVFEYDPFVIYSIEQYGLNELKAEDPVMYAELITSRRTEKMRELVELQKETKKSVKDKAKYDEIMAYIEEEKRKIMSS